MKAFNLALAGLALLGLSACAGGQLTPAGTAAVNTAIADGQQFCAVAQSPGLTTIVRLVAASTGVPVTVTDKAADVVAATCPVIAGIKSFPVSPPPAPATVPIVAVPVTVAAKT